MLPRKLQEASIITIQSLWNITEDREWSWIILIHYTFFHVRWNTLKRRFTTDCRSSWPIFDFFYFNWLVSHLLVSYEHGIFFPYFLGKLRPEIFFKLFTPTYYKFPNIEKLKQLLNSESEESPTQVPSPLNVCPTHRKNRKKPCHERYIFKA